MNKNIDYSNDLTKVRKVCEDLGSEKFRKKYVLITKANKYYVYQDKRYDTKSEAIVALKKQGIKAEDVHFIEQWGGYYSACFAKFVAGNNNEWLDIILCQTSFDLKYQTIFETDRGYWTKIFRFYKDHKFKIFRFREGNWEIQNGPYNFTRNPGIISDKEFGLYDRDCIKRYLCQSVNDLDCDYNLSLQSKNNYDRELSAIAKNIIGNVFNPSVERFEKIKTWTDLREFLRKSGLERESSAKAAATRETLIREVFRPICKNIHNFENLVISKTTCVIYKHSQGFYRINEWIIFATRDNYKYYFYNVETKKRYLVKYYPWAEDEHSCAISVFDYGFLKSCLNNYADYYGRDTSDFKPCCYNEEKKEISPLECFKGTIVLDFLNISKDFIFFDRERKENKPDTYEELIKENRCPGIAFLLLFVKEDKRRMVEQLIKLKLNGWLLKLLLDPKSFETNEFCDFNKKGTNLKKMLGLSMDRIRVYDNFLIEEYSAGGRTPMIPSILTIKTLLQENFDNIDIELFKEYVQYLKKHPENVCQTERLVEFSIEHFPKKSPKEFLRMLWNIGNITTFLDYQRLREQYLSLFDGEERKEIERNYPIMPEKARKFKYITNQTSNLWVKSITIDTLRRLYGDITFVYSEPGGGLIDNLIGAILNMSVSEHICYLHDELSIFVAEHAKEIEARGGGFKEAATRLAMWEYKGEELSIVAPKESKDLAIEGSALHHCVAGFIDPVIKNTENVLFIRRNDMPDVPYYTIALNRKGDIEQIHGFRNNNLTGSSQKEAYAESAIPSYNKCFDLIKFLKEWANKKKGLVNLSTIRSYYGVFGARR